MVVIKKFNVLFYTVSIFLLNPLESSPISKCHLSCKECDQNDDPNSCIKCHDGHFKLSMHIDSNVFACVADCQKPEKLHYREYDFCSLKIYNTTTSATTLAHELNHSQTLTSAFYKEVYFYIIILNIIIFIMFALVLISFIFILCILKANSANNKKNDVESAQMIQQQKNHPIKIAKTNESPSSKTQYNSLRNVDASEFSKGDVIGGGAYSRVHEGKLDGQSVAIKVALKEGRKSIHTELKIYDNIRHPNILEALGYHLAIDNSLFLLLRKSNLAEYFLQYNSEIENQQLIKYCVQITDAIKYLHEKEILHCDLKIDNILVKDDKGKEVEISDFGCAVDISQKKLTRFHGTETHTAYELLKIMELHLHMTSPNYRGTKATDVWAYAVTMWQIFSKTGILPNDFNRAEQIIENYEKGKKLRKPLEMPERLWRYVFLQCFDLHPEGRPSMKEIFESITSELSSSEASKKLQN